MKAINKYFVLIILVGTMGCHTPTSNTPKSSVVSRDSTFNKLFHQNSSGLTGADGTISVPMPDGSSVFMMGDSFLGKVVDNKRDTSTKMIHNTFVVVNPTQPSTRTLFQGTYQDPESFVIPKNDPGKFYWPANGFVRDSVFHFFASRFYMSGNGMWGFKFVDTDYFRYSWPDFKPLSVEPFKFTSINHVHWGHAILDAGKYIYIYGCKPDSNKVSKAFACRTHVDNSKYLDLNDVEFSDGHEWSKDPMSIEPMQGTTSQISEQFSVFHYKDKYILLSQDRGLGNGKIFTYTSDTPVGPWGNRQLIYKTTESDSDKDIITYNAMAHPQYIRDGKLLVSYNVNSLKLSKVFENVNNYRPRFIRIPMDKIINNTAKK
jgi:hypothetical protein